MFPLLDRQRVMLLGELRFYLRKLLDFKWVVIPEENMPQVESTLYNALEFALNMGHGIAQDEIISTPWEYWTVQLSSTARFAERDQIRHMSIIHERMDSLARDGWEPHHSVGEYMVWRRRKAVGEIKEKSNIFSSAPR